MEKFRNLP